MNDSTDRCTAGWLPPVAATHGSIGLHRERTDLHALLTSSLAPLVAQSKEQHVELRVETMGIVPRVVVDREKLAWAVAALVGNALRYVTRRGDDDYLGGSILVHLVHDEDRREVSVSIQDDGPGVPSEKLPHLFVRRPGTLHADGLALLLVRDIVGAHDGRIQVESSADRDGRHGTSITIYLACEV